MYGVGAPTGAAVRSCPDGGPADDPYPAGAVSSSFGPAPFPDVPAPVLTDSAGWLVTDSFAGSAPPAPATSTVPMTVPSDTVSPTARASETIVPATGDGTSRVALSLSRVSSGSSAATVSPAATRISMIGTSVKSPMSGTRISCAAMPHSFLGAGGVGERSEEQAPVVLEQVAQVAGEPGC